MSGKQTLSEGLQYAVSIIEQQIAQQGQITMGQQEGEHWEVLLIAVVVKDGQASLHASSSETPEQACYIAGQFMAQAMDPGRSRYAPKPPKVV